MMYITLPYIEDENFLNLVKNLLITPPMKPAVDPEPIIPNCFLTDLLQFLIACKIQKKQIAACLLHEGFLEIMPNFII